MENLEKKQVRKYYSKLAFVVIILVAVFNFANDGMTALCAALMGGGFDKEAVKAGYKLFYKSPVLTAMNSYLFPFVADIGAVAVGMAVTKKSPFAKLQAKGFDGKDLFNFIALAMGISTIGALIGGIITAVAASISGLGTSLAEDPSMITDYVAPKNPLWLDILIYLYICLLGPILEELIFRGVLLDGLKKYGNAFGIIMSAVMFGLFHQRMAQCFSAITFGLVLGFIAVKTESIMPTVIIHILNNTLSSLLMVTMRLVDTSLIKDFKPDMMMDKGFLHLLYTVFAPVLLVFLILGLFRGVCLFATFFMGLNFYRGGNKLLAPHEQCKERTWKTFFTSVPWLLVIGFLTVKTFINII